MTGNLPTDNQIIWNKLLGAVCHLPHSFIIKFHWSRKHRHTVWGLVPQPNSWHIHCSSPPKCLLHASVEMTPNQHSSTDAPSSWPQTPQSAAWTSNQDPREQNLDILQRLHPSALCCAVCFRVLRSLYFSLQSQQSTQAFSSEMYWSDCLFLTFNDSGKLDSTHRISLSNDLFHI